MLTEIVLMSEALVLGKREEKWNSAFYPEESLANDGQEVEVRVTERTPICAALSACPTHWLIHSTHGTQCLSLPGSSQRVGDSKMQSRPKPVPVETTGDDADRR